MMMASTNLSQRSRAKASNTSSTDASPANAHDMSPATSPSSSRRPLVHPLQPTSLEVMLVAVYPLTLLAGSLIALLSPTIRNAPYDPVEQAYEVDGAPSYFATKKNIVNQLFVKRGWLWITTSFVVYVAAHPFLGRSSTAPGGKTGWMTARRRAALVRWALVTAWWVAVTQWFFGPPIMDRAFVLTGGHCELVKHADGEENTAKTAVKKILSSLACRAIGGKWKGGHDISGHVFLLVSGSLFLLMEVLHVVMRVPGSKEQRTVLTADGQIQGAESEPQGPDNIGHGQWDSSSKIITAVAALSWWMLLMTAMFFHTWFEKVTGLLVALTGIFVVYFLPRVVPPMRAIIGMPGL